MRLNATAQFLFASRMQDTHLRTVNRTLERLASGTRIVRAADDAAGLGISSAMKGRLRSLNQAARNIQDGISLTQTAEGALQEISTMLVRGRELAVQAANGTLATSNRQSLHDEVRQILAEIDRIANGTQFNNTNLLNAVTTSSADQQALIDGLQTSWLKASETLIQNQYGLLGDGASLKIVLDQNSGPYLAYVSYYVDPVTGKATSQELHLDVSDFLPATLPNGGTAPMYDDRIIAHEMVHAVMGRTMNFASLPTWFKEGTAEFIHGADERLAGDIAANGGGAAGRNAVVNAIDAWASDSLHYSSGYAAAKYLDSKIGGGIETVMTQLSANPTWNLDQAINAASGGTYATTAAFIADFKANGAAFIASLNLADADTGAVGGGTASSVVADLAGPATTDPLAGFVEEWPTVTAGTSSVTIQVGADAADTLDISLAAAGISDLGLSNVDIASQARQAIDQFDAAIKIVAQLRGNFGASMNRLEHVHNVTMTEYENLAASNSRIEDADVAQEVATLTRSQILLQASTSLIAQINQSPRSALTLLQAA